ncbi:hypothetical protein ACLOJK_010881 [Asimina triloba]
MANRPAAEIIEEAHPYAFHVSVNLLLYAVYLLELDRQENRTEENGLAPKWWKPFKYKLSQTLIDHRDGSIFGAIIEWDRVSAFSDFIVMRPRGAPQAVLALRGTLLKSPTIRRDLEDDLRFLAWESLKGSVRFNIALEALKSLVDRYGSCNVCIAGHSLGAGFALQVGKALAKEGVYVESHLFNPPSVSLAMSFRNIGEKAGFMWKRIRGIFPSNSEAPSIVAPGGPGEESKVGREIQKWVPHLYVNNSDYICCYYTDPAAPYSSGNSEKPKANTVGDVAAAKLFVMSKGPQKFLEAHGLEQWWSSDMELQSAINQSRLINQQLKSLYTLQSQGKA